MVLRVVSSCDVAAEKPHQTNDPPQRERGRRGEKTNGDKLEGASQQKFNLHRFKTAGKQRVTKGIMAQESGEAETT